MSACGFLLTPFSWLPVSLSLQDFGIDPDYRLGIRKMQEASVDEEYQYELFKKEEENKKLEKQAEEAEFFSIFEKTGTYPI